MARQTRLFPKGKFIIRTPKNDIYNVYLQYTWQRGIYIKSTGLQVKKSDWDSTANNGRGQFSSSYNGAAKLNSTINIILENTDAAFFRFIVSHSKEQLTDSVFKQILNGENPDNKQNQADIDFVDFVCSRLEKEYEKGKIGISRYKNGLSCMKQFNRFLQLNMLGTYNKHSIKLNEVNIDIIEKYIKYRRDILKNTDETINHSLTPIIKACNYASSLGVIDAAIL